MQRTRFDFDVITGPAEPRPVPKPAPEPNPAHGATPPAPEPGK